MTESKKRSDADAVLSSVRRIVTRQLTAEELGAPPPATPETREESQPQKLLLTPALRVETPAPVAPAPKGNARSRLEARIAELELAVGAVDDDFEPDGSEVREGSSPLAFSPDPVPSGDEPPVEEAPMAVDAPTLEPEELGAPVLFPGTAARRGSPEPESEPEREAEPSCEPAQATDDSEDERTVQQALGELTDAMEIDEDTLRDLVAEIVRSELQGELGERITRNVRKLVRREIHRALMTRDFS